MQFHGPNLAAIGVGTPIPMVNVQLKVNSAMHVEAITTTLCCASKRDAGKTRSNSKEALSPTSAATAVDIVPAAPHVGTATEVIACIAIPGPISPPHLVLPVVHPLGTPLIPKGALHPIGTTRML